MAKLLLVETSDIGTRYSAEAAAALGLEPFFLANLGDYQADPRAALMRYSHLDVSTEHAPEMVEALKRSGVKDIAAVATFMDTRLKPATELARILGVPGPDLAIIRLKDKGQVAAWTPEDSPATLTFDPAVPPLPELTELFRRYGKLILKPTEAAGALGVFTLDDFADLARLKTLIEERAVPFHLASRGWVAQGFVSGDLISLEGYVLDSHPFFLGFTSRKKIGATESRAEFPIDERLDPHLRASAHQAVQRLVARSGFRNGYFHVEFIVAPSGVVMIDANMGRVGGGPIGQQLALSYGVAPQEIYRHVLEVGIFHRDDANPYSRISPQDRQSSLAILYGLKHGGKLRRVRLPLELRSCFHTQILESGTQVTPMGTNDWSWIGILTGLTEDTLKAAQGIRIDTESGEQPPCY